MNAEVFSTCPQFSAASSEAYLEQVIQVARWSEECECKGILVYTDNSQLDPWLVAQVIVQNTRCLCPLVAVQPVYTHPYTVAKMVSTLGHLYGRRIYLNMVAGGFKNDLTALHDTTPHDRRYSRLIEYTTIIKRLLSSPCPVAFRGEFYSIDKPNMTPALPADLFPGIFISGSSEAGLAAAKELRATAVKYPQPTTEYANGYRDPTEDAGIRVGIIARKDNGAAWTVAQERFPHDRKGQITHGLAMKTSDSVWHKQLSDAASNARDEGDVFWMLPFETYKTFCPYLVGSYDEVARVVARYLAIGYRKIILDIPASKEELEHTRVVFDAATRELASAA